MNLLFVRRGFRLKLMAGILCLGMLHSCKKNESAEPIAGTDAQKLDASLSKKANDESAEVVYQWYKFMTKLQLPAAPQPVVLLNNRNFGFIGVGLYEAVQPGIKTAKSLSEVLYQMPAMPEPDKRGDYLWSASANAALASMFKLFLPGLSLANKTSIDSMEAANNGRLQLMAPADVLARSQDFGRSVATAIYNWSTTDNFNLSSAGYMLPVCPSCWVPTPPAFAAAVGPYLKDSKPFLELSLTAVAPPPPVPYSENPSSAFYKAAKQVYDIGVSLTAEQKAIANWWADAGGTGVGVPSPYHILSIVTNVLESQGANLWKAAEMYAKTGIGLKDGPIVTFRTKYQYNLLRPVTYIQRHISASWLPYLPTPPYPEYISGLISNYGPVIQVLIKEFGDIPVTDNAYSWRGLAPRNYSSLNQLLSEAAVSRVYAGIHYQFTQDVSVEVGKALGNVISNLHKIGPNH